MLFRSTHPAVLPIHSKLFMSTIDWIVLFGTLIGIVAYGVWKTRGANTMDSYLRGSEDVKWWAIGLSIMATQASAITFLSTPGQAYNDGMGLTCQSKTKASSRSCHVAYRPPSAVELSLDQIDHSMETFSISDGHLQTYFRLAQSLINDC